MSKEKLKEMVTSLLKKETILSKQNENVFFFGFLLLKIISTPLLISGLSALFIEVIKEVHSQISILLYQNILQDVDLP